MHLSKVIGVTGCDFGCVSPHKLDVPLYFPDVSNNETCENAGIVFFVISREKVFTRISFEDLNSFFQFFPSNLIKLLIR